MSVSVSVCVCVCVCIGRCVGGVSGWLGRVLGVEPRYKQIHG